MTEVNSVYEVTDFKTGESWREVLKGVGQGPIEFLRKEYPRFTKFVLDGFEIDGNLIPLKIRR